MPQDIYEQLVQDYLTIKEHLAVVPQFHIRFGSEGSPRFREEADSDTFKRLPDFLALDIKGQKAWVVEVTMAWSPQFGKWNAKSRAQAEEYVLWFTGWKPPTGWRLGWRFFARRGRAKTLRDNLAGLGFLDPEVTSLEDVFDYFRDVMP